VTEPAFHVVPLTPLRKAIAARMMHAVSIPHFRLTAEIELDALSALRRRLRDEQPESFVSLNSLLIKACAATLTEVPAVNLQWTDTEVHQYRHADISVVTSVPGGVVTPIVRQADTKTIWEVSREARDLIKRAAHNSLKTSEILGGSFSISNLGMYGVDQFDAIINAPQCAILAVAAAKRRIIASADLEFRTASSARMTLSVDHRAIDGITGARFMSALKERIEHPHLIPLGTV
jgi:pyruvate dehydrogenase E2 component (dihydrolipoamide acetyltransferase)